MSKRSITIEATGCHDCPLLHYDSEWSDYWCACLGGYEISQGLGEAYDNRCFHPDCPMKPIEESE